MSPGQKFRQLLQKPGIIRTVGAHDVFTARLCELAGVEMIFLGGFGASASLLGLPDVGLLTLSEMADSVRRTTMRIQIPVIADGDTGHGDLHNVARTVQEFEHAGAAGMLLEDQVSPKRCGHFEGKQVIPMEEMVLKLKVALAARKNPDFVIFARTDSRVTEGIEGAINRARRYGEVGADVCFIEAPQTRSELEQIPKAVPYPVMANMLLGGVTPILGAEDLEKMGYKIMVWPIETLLVAGAAIQKLIGQLLNQGIFGVKPEEIMSFAQVKESLGLKEILGWREKV